MILLNDAREIPHDEAAFLFDLSRHAQQRSVKRYGASTVQPHEIERARTGRLREMAMA